MKNFIRFPSFFPKHSFGKKRRLAIILAISCILFLSFKTIQLFSEETPADHASGSTHRPKKKDRKKITGGEPLFTDYAWNLPPIEPLDTMIRFQRSDDNNDRAMTHEILSLIHEEKGKNSYPWTIYSHLTTHHENGDACVLCSRLTKYGPGWSSGLHSEVFNHERGVALGVNIETTNHVPVSGGSLVIGMNVQAHGPQPCQIGIQVHDFEDGFYQKAIALNNKKGDVGLDIGGKYNVGIHAHSNTIRVSEGTCIEFDDEGKIKMRYQNGRIEFLNGDKCIGHINVNGEDHEL